MPKSKKAEKKKIGSHQTRRVYILGAGVSASCGIAVARDILREAVTRLAKRNAEQANLVHSLLSYLYPSFDEQFKSYPNVEDFLNLLEMARLFNSEDFIESTLWPIKKLETVKTLTLKAITDYIWGFMQDKKQLDPLFQFARICLRPGDVIITFNWDLSLERAVDDREFGIVYRYSETKPKDTVVLLKPHGSVDWFLKSSITNRKLKREVWSLDDKVCVFPYFDFAEHPTVLKSDPLIVPPVASKAFEYDVLKRTWRHVYWAIARATELIVMGYSLPKEDQFARLVIRRGLRTNIQNGNRGLKPPLRVAVINPDETVALTFQRLTGQGVREFRYFQTTFQNYLDGLEED